MNEYTVQCAVWTQKIASLSGSAQSNSKWRCLKNAYETLHPVRISYIVISVN